MQKRLVVAGGGVIGWALARRLTQLGAQVVVCDPAPLSGNASAVAAGMLAPGLEAALDDLPSGHYSLLSAALAGWNCLEQDAGLLIDRGDALVVGSTPFVQHLADQLARLSVNSTALKLQAVQQIAPGAAAGLSVSGERRIEPEQGLARLRAAALGGGVHFIDQSVVRFAQGEVWLGSGERLPADGLVLATGLSAGLAEVAPEIGLLSPIKGQILHLPQASPTPAVIRGEGVYIVPAAQGVLVGATMEFGRSDLTPDRPLTDTLRRRAAKLIPALAEGPAEIRVGVRAATPDGLPMVGPSSTPGVWLAVGMRRNGWLLAPLVADVLIARMEGRQSPWSAMLDPRRFDP